MDAKVVMVTARQDAYARPYALRCEAKALNIDSEAQKAVYWRAFERTRMKWYGKMARLVAKEFESERDEVMQAVKGVTVRNADDAAAKALKGQRDAWVKFYRVSYLAIGEDFAPPTISAVEGKAKADDAWMKYLLNWIDKQSGTKITQIQGTTLDRIRAQLSEGMEEGETMEQIAKRISGVYDDNVSSRSMTIARTEVINASNASSYAGAKSTGAKVDKRWLSSRDGRVRTDHANADGQTVGMDEPFTVGGYDLMWPGDTSLGAPAEQVINCRCTQTYVRK